MSAAKLYRFESADGTLYMVASMMIGSAAFGISQEGVHRVLRELEQVPNGVSEVCFNKRGKLLFIDEVFISEFKLEVR